MRFILAMVLAVLLASAAPAAETITVSAAVSLKNALTEIGEQYAEATGDRVELRFGSSGQLAGQIKAGAPIDAFISAANQQVDDLAEEGLVDAATRRVVARNALVLIVPAEHGDGIAGLADLAEPAVKRVAAGEPETVPAGRYAAQVFEALKLAEALRDKLVYGTNVRQVLDYVERGEVSAGMVYRTDALASGGVKVVVEADPATHEPIVYPGVVVIGSAKRAAAIRFLEYLATQPAIAVLESKGFVAPERGGP